MGTLLKLLTLNMFSSEDISLKCDVDFGYGVVLDSSSIYSIYLAMLICLPCVGIYSIESELMASKISLFSKSTGEVISSFYFILGVLLIELGVIFNSSFFEIDGKSRLLGFFG